MAYWKKHADRLIVYKTDNGINKLSFSYITIKTNSSYSTNSDFRYFNLPIEI